MIYLMYKSAKFGLVLTVTYLQIYIYIYIYIDTLIRYLCTNFKKLHEVRQVKIFFESANSLVSS